MRVEHTKITCDICGVEHDGEATRNITVDNALNVRENGRELPHHHKFQDVCNECFVSVVKVLNTLSGGF